MLSFIFPLFSSASVSLPVVATSIQFTGSTWMLGGIPYYAPPNPVGQIHVKKDIQALAISISQEFIPFSVVSSAEAGSLASTFERWSGFDDVWTTSFLMGLYTNGTSIPASVKNSYNIQLTLQSHPLLDLPSGPYFLSSLTGKVYQAYRLYTDENQAFLYGVIPASNGSYKQLPAHTDGAHTSTIGVPSRLYFTPSPAKPFAGYRLAVKDIYDIAGLRTGCGNRAYYQTYPVKNVTAVSIQRLIDAGMVIIGKVKTSQFANGETATDDWVDLHAPYNPRGDGYQDGSSSSTGPGSALASYDWVDFTVGSDTSGSMRGPAAKNGLFGNRPSHGAMPLDNVMPLSPTFDTAGIFSRDATLWAQAAKLWYTDLKDYTKYPQKLLFPVDVFGASFLTNPPPPGSANEILDTFLKKVEGFLGVTRTEMNLTSLWADTRPVNATLDLLLNTSYTYITTSDQVNLVGNAFYADYGAMHGGRVPFVNPSPVSRWALGRNLTQSVYQEALANKTLFKSWVDTQLLPGNQSDTCSEAIFVYPQSVGSTTYRNAYKGPPVQTFGWTITRLSVYAEVPDSVVPVGEVAYNSTITLKTEYLPVTMSFVAAKNCDLMLFNLFADLQKMGILYKVNTGTRMFLGGKSNSLS